MDRIDFGQARVAALQNSNLTDPSSSGETGQSFRIKVAEIAKDYMNSHPGADNLGGNVAIHSVAKKCIQGQIEDHEKLAWLLRCLEYRNGLVTLADQYVSHACCLPDFVTCADWIPDTFPTTTAEVGDIATYKRFLARVYWYRLFPSPLEEQGFCWTKPPEYLSMAFLASGFTDDQVEEKLEELSAFSKRMKMEVQEVL